MFFISLVYSYVHYEEGSSLIKNWQLWWIGGEIAAAGQRQAANWNQGGFGPFGSPAAGWQAPAVAWRGDRHSKRSDKQYHLGSLSYF